MPRFMPKIGVNEKPNKKLDQQGAYEAESAEPSSRILWHLEIGHIDVSDSFLWSVNLKQGSLPLFDRS